MYVYACMYMTCIFIDKKNPKLYTKNCLATKKVCYQLLI